MVLAVVTPANGGIRKELQVFLDQHFIFKIKYLCELWVEREHQKP
ncbi:MAG: hypothetical protein ETSY2_41730 [Candidatus Entotheonella gemina]|uniref:Uncharacterized protein n=1 Tax=Candidatus Entotheonella gemina TaxID=1429439 RepID=W4LLZ6_9BACT|nr:MAG: hypothetical protein ETSY2_41730 [Candidatus Entotheonella gemina]